MSWNHDLSRADAHLIDRFQSGFPVTERPFRAVGEALGESEERLLSRVRRLDEDGLFRRVGPVLNPPVIGSSTLAALSVPETDFEEAAEIVNSYESVNHNYGREHRFNMWFVVTTETRARREEILDDIESRIGDPLLRLPMRTEYYIDLEFPVVNDDHLAREGWSTETPVEPTAIQDRACSDLTALDRRLIPELQGGLPLSPTPYRDIAERVEASVRGVLDAIERLSERNCIKRIGCVVNHHAVGFDENCMVVWDIPDAELDERAVAAGRHPSVTYCCHRPRREAAGWSHNLFTMIHGRNREAVEATIDDLAAEHVQCDHARLHTTEVLKQTGVRYSDLLAVDTETTPEP
ncbi:siroheme decarboxylase subunit beta [Halovenus sp. HT40]|uniref:siroheme decarboxylase subunit beta n=1 Tax=Halovenus sp. HT40 TaxID=3126691 RepID=UPI00300F1154